MFKKVFSAQTIVTGAPALPGPAHYLFHDEEVKFLKVLFVPYSSSLATYIGIQGDT